MFAQYDIKQATDHCAIMHTKGWLYCWLSKHNSSVEFGQGLVKSLQKKPIYETIRKSDEIFFNLLFTRGDKKTAIVLGCNPRSSQGMSLFKQTLQWAKINGLSLEIAPNITTDDGETRIRARLKQSHSGRSYSEERNRYTKDCRTVRKWIRTYCFGWRDLTKRTLPTILATSS
jgi:hypothetical protein